MNTAARHFIAASRPRRGSLARYGTIGSLVLWGLTLAGVPFYVLTALIAGSIYALIDSVFPRKGRASSRSDKPTIDGLNRLLHRLTASLEGAQRAFVSRQADRVVVSLPRQGSFPAGEAVPSQGARDLLARLVRVIEAGSWRIDVIGYGDGQLDDGLPPRAPAHADLSANRARATIDALRGAGCRSPMAAVGVPLDDVESRRASPVRLHAVAEPAAIDIVIRRARRETQHAA